MLAADVMFVNYLVVGRRFSSHATGTSYTINHSLDCNSGNIV